MQHIPLQSPWWINTTTFSRVQHFLLQSRWSITTTNSWQGAVDDCSNNQTSLWPTAPTRFPIPWCVSKWARWLCSVCGLTTMTVQRATTRSMSRITSTIQTRTSTTVTSRSLNITSPRQMSTIRHLYIHSRNPVHTFLPMHKIWPCKLNLEWLFCHFTV